MRATVELYENSSEGLPPVKAMVTLGKEDLSIKVPHRTVSQKHEYLWRLIQIKAHSKSALY